VLPITVKEEFLEKIFAQVFIDANTQLIVDLEAETLTIAATGESLAFEINPYKKSCLINGYDDIDFILNHSDKIKNFEQSRPFSFYR
ncbi:MAG: 3-isopropylmalate dehydratase small subunit, partial [Sphingobacterium sp.]